MTKDLIIPDSVYPYLLVQKGEINHITMREGFERAYNDGLQYLFNLIEKHIPAPIESSLDIGSGMGGIDILLQKHFKHEVTLLDALETPAICTKHDIAFNSSRIASEFFKINGATLNNYIAPEDVINFNAPDSDRKFDLILSVGSYCFHYSPLKYLEFVKASCHKDTVLIFDVRNTHPDWLEILRENFTEVAAIWAEYKFTKRVFKCR